MERVRFLRQGLVTSVADGLGIMPVRRVSGLRGARCTGIGEGVQNSRLYPVIPGSAGPGRGRTKVRSIRSGAPKGERSRKGSRLYLVTGAVLYPRTVRCSASLFIRGSRKAWPTFGPIIATRHNAQMRPHRENVPPRRYYRT
jgi:hypothetical protein